MRLSRSLNNFLYHLLELVVDFHIVEILLVRSVQSMSRRNCSDTCLVELSKKLQTVFQKVLIGVGVVAEAMADRQILIMLVWTVKKAGANIFIRAEDGVCLMAALLWCGLGMPFPKQPWY